MKKTIAITVIVLVVVGLGAFLFGKSKKSSSTLGTSTSQLSISLTEITKHNTQADCWTIIEGNVYNLTTFIKNHPGGGVITTACGKDATAEFTGKSTRGKVHSQFARSLLSSLKLGILAQ